MSNPIRLTRVRQNNLKNISVEIPAKQLTVVTGLSGSGKSSLVFDTLYAEGQRRYIESLSTYTRQFLEKMPKPDLDGIENIPPAIALEQKNHVVNSRSTVGTQTEIFDYLRVLYARVGHTFCPDCQQEIKKLDAQSILDWSLKWLPGKKALIAAPLAAPPQPKIKKKSHQPVKLVSLFQILREQGYQRVLFVPHRKHKNKSPAVQLIELEDLEAFARESELPAFEAGLFYVVVDRLRLTADPDRDTQSRILDSIEQALSVGHGQVVFYDLDQKEWKAFDSRFACTQCGKEYRTPEPHLFSFNSPLGACSHCSGFGYTLDLDESLVVPDPTKTLKNGAIDPFSKPSAADWQKALFRFAERHGISIGKRYQELTASERKLLWEGDPKDSTFPGIIACFEELKRWKYKIHVRVFIRRYQSQSLCLQCQGTRLKTESLAVKINHLNIAQFLQLPVTEALNWMHELALAPREKKIAEEALQQIKKRLLFLKEVGLGYLTLSRLTKTLSGGEFQRINLATQLGNGLCGTLYVLDEPSIGLHASDTQKLIQILKTLKNQGNTVVVVEHDLEVMKAADWLIELGPGAGSRGGELIAAGSSQEIEKIPGSLTGKYLSGSFQLRRTRNPRPPARRLLKLTGCRENNLKDIDVEFPLDRLVVVTGVSGSGKSTLVHQTLYQSLSRLFYKTNEPTGRFDRLYGAEQLSGVVLLDQSPIGKSSRSNPATYLKAWDEIRRIFANQVLSLRRGYTPQHFSFNVDGGRCPVCKGDGEITLDMHFMAELRLPCEECDGKRFKKSILDITYRGKNVDQLLHTTLDEAFELFRDNSILVRKLGILREVGLGYLQLGQPAPTLSGGESQRLKIASSLDDRSAENLLYLFDEPTTGLHLEDIKKLMDVIQDLVDARNSVIMIEHQLDVIAQADWVIDLGPEGGALGGRVLGASTPYKLIRNEDSITGKILKQCGYESRISN